MPMPSVRVPCSAHDRARIRRTLPAMLLAALSACAGNSAIESGSLEVTVRDPATGGGVPAASVRLTGTSLAAITNAAGIAVISDVRAGAQPIRVQSVGFCVNDRTVRIAPAIRTKVTIWNCGDVVEVHNAPTEPAIAVLDLRIGSGPASQCLADELRQGVGYMDVGMNAMPITPCHGAVALLTRNHAVYFSNDASALPWTASPGDVLSVNVSPSLLHVPIRVTISSHASLPYAGVLQLTQDQLKMAGDILSNDLAGFDLAGDETGAPVVIREATAAQKGIIGTGCANVAAIRATPALYSQGHLNIFVVEQATDHYGNDIAGTSCLVEQAPDIIFVSPRVAKPHTLLHEVGHSLGLQRPMWGHTDGLEGFWGTNPSEPLNLMDSGRALAIAYLSVGQVLRMTIAEESWLNLPSAPNGSTVRQRQAPGSSEPLSVPCGCPASEATDDCAALSRDISRTGVKNEPTTGTLACGTFPVGPLAVSCGAPTNVTAVLSPVGALGSARFVSLDPMVLTVTPSDNNSKMASLTGVANGTGRVSVWADGSPSMFTVVVSGCP